MELETTKVLKENVTVNTSIDDIINIFKNSIKTLNNHDEYLACESIVMPDKKFKYFYFSIFANLKEGKRIVQIKVELKYESVPQFFVLQNLFWTEKKDEFVEKVRETDAYKYITSKNIKPKAVSILELDI